MELVILKIFDTAIDAHILKGKLESEDIECYIYDENIVTLNPLFNFAVGGIKLKVNKDDFSKAKSILTEIDNKPYTDNQDEIIKCPNCSSTELYSDFKSMKDVKGIIAAIAAFLFTVFPIYYKSVYKCKKCNTEFKLRQ
jgi:DNA-directed RNA polymerase subunit RPC12/RpoP